MSTQPGKLTVTLNLTYGQLAALFLELEQQAKPSPTTNAIYDQIKLQLDTPTHLVLQSYELRYVPAWAQRLAEKAAK